MVLDNKATEEELFRVAEELYAASNCGNIDKAMKTFLSREAFPLILHSITGKLQVTLQETDLPLQRRSLTSKMNQEELTQRVIALTETLNSSHHQAAFEHVRRHVDELEQKAVALVEAWYNKYLPLSNDIAAGTQVHYPTQQAASGAAAELAKSCYTRNGWWQPSQVSPPSKANSRSYKMRLPRR